MGSRARIAALGVAAVVSSVALAGFKTVQQVYISDAAKVAYGDMGYVRNTADNVQYIGCDVTGEFGTCFARDSSGLTRSCSTSTVRWMNTIRAVQGDSYLYFRWDANGECTTVYVENRSASAPKK